MKTVIVHLYPEYNHVTQQDEPRFHTFRGATWRVEDDNLVVSRNTGVVAAFADGNWKWVETVEEGNDAKAD